MKLLLLSILISFVYACEDAWKANTGSGCQACLPGQVPNAQQTGCDAVPLNAVVQYGYALVDDVNSCEGHPGHATLDAAGCTEYGNTLNPTQQPITGHRWIEPQGCSLGRGSNLYFTVTGLICGANNFPCVCRSPPVSYTECPPGKIAVNNECVTCTTDQQCADAFSDKPYCIEKASGNECKARSECSDVDANGHLNYKGPNTVESLAFYGCTSLQSISMPQVEIIESRAFHNSGLTSISLPKATSIGDTAFYNCSALTTVDLPLVTSIGHTAFYGCSALTTVDLPLVTTIQGITFYGCSALQNISMPQVLSIEQSAFYGCSALTSISLPKATSIGKYAFRGCTSLTTVDLPLVTTVGQDIFRDCSALTSLKMDSIASVGRLQTNSIIEDAFKDTLQIFSAASATTIEMYTFTYFPLNTANIPNAITIEKYAFSDTLLLTIELPKVQSIGEKAFQNTALEIINLPEATSIASNAGDFLAIAPKCTDTTTCLHTGILNGQDLNNIKPYILGHYSPEELKEEYQSRGECPTIN